MSTATRVAAAISVYSEAINGRRFEFITESRDIFYNAIHKF